MWVTLQLPICNVEKWLIKAISVCYLSDWGLGISVLQRSFIIYLSCFLLSEIFSYYLYLMDLTVEFFLCCSNASQYSPRPEFLRCDKVQWVKFDGSACDAVRSHRPPQPRLFLLSLSLLSCYIYIIVSDIRDSSLV